jgi:hypothetical protein
VFNSTKVTIPVPGLRKCPPVVVLISMPVWEGLKGLMSVTAAESKGSTVMVCVAGSSDLTLAVALSDPLVAVIVAVPYPNEVTRPASDTVATAVSDVAHLTVAPSITSLLASVTVAVSCVVSASETNVSTESDNDRVAAA